MFDGFCNTLSDTQNGFDLLFENEGFNLYEGKVFNDEIFSS